MEEIPCTPLTEQMIFCFKFKRGDLMNFSRKDTKVNLSFSAKIAVISSMIALLIMSASVITFDALSNSVTVIDGGSKETKVLTFKNTVEEVLKEQGIVLNSGDKLNLESGDSLRDDMTIEVYRAMQVYITADGETRTVNTTKRKISDILADAGYELTDEDTVTPNPTRIAKADTKIVLVRNTTETVTVTEETEFASTETPNALAM